MAKKLLSTTVDETVIECIKQYQQDNKLATFSETTETLLRIGLTQTAQAHILHNVNLAQLILNDLSNYMKEGRIKIIDHVLPRSIENKEIDLNNQYTGQPASTRDKIDHAIAVLKAVNIDVLNLQKKLEEVQTKPNESDTLKEAIKVIQNECNKIIPPQVITPVQPVTVQPEEIDFTEPIRLDILKTLGLDEPIDDELTEEIVFPE